MRNWSFSLYFRNKTVHFLYPLAYKRAEHTVLCVRVSVLDMFPWSTWTNDSEPINSVLNSQIGIRTIWWWFTSCVLNYFCIFKWILDKVWENRRVSPCEAASPKHYRLTIESKSSDDIDDITECLTVNFCWFSKILTSKPFFVHFNLLYAIDRDSTEWIICCQNIDWVYSIQICVQ